MQLFVYLCALCNPECDVPHGADKAHWKGGNMRAAAPEWAGLGTLGPQLPGEVADMGFMVTKSVRATKRYLWSVLDPQGERLCAAGTQEGVQA